MRAASQRWGPRSRSARSRGTTPPPGLAVAQRLIEPPGHVIRLREVASLVELRPGERVLDLGERRRGILHSGDPHQLADDLANDTWSAAGSADPRFETPEVLDGSLNRFELRVGNQRQRHRDIAHLDHPLRDLGQRGNRPEECLAPFHLQAARRHVAEGFHRLGDELWSHLRPQRLPFAAHSDVAIPAAVPGFAPAWAAPPVGGQEVRGQGAGFCADAQSIERLGHDLR